MRNIILILAMASFLILNAATIFAEDTLNNAEILKELKAMEQRIAELEAKVEQQQEVISQQQEEITKHRGEIEATKDKAWHVDQQQQEISEHLGKVEETVDRAWHYEPGGGLTIGGIEMSLDATVVFQATDHANTNNDRDENAANYNVDLEFARAFGDFGKAFLKLTGGQGDGVTDELTVFSNVNGVVSDSDDRVEVNKFYYEHYFKAIPLAITGGKLDPTDWIDANEYANDEETQFLGGMFVNSPGIEFPADNGFGFRAGLSPIDLVGLDLVIMDGDADWDNAFDNIFLSAQANIKPKLFGRDGNYRFIYVLNNRDHTKWVDSTITDRENFGFALSCDQQLTDNISVFGRYSWQDPKVFLNGAAFSLEQFWSVGAQLSGNLWGRKNDKLGLAIGYAIPSHEYKDATPGLDANSEGHLEGYYSWYVNKCLAISPDVQLVWDPYGSDAANGSKTIFVGGLRGQVDF